MRYTQPHWVSLYDFNRRAKAPVLLEPTTRQQHVAEAATLEERKEFFWQWRK